MNKKMPLIVLGLFIATIIGVVMNNHYQSKRKSLSVDDRLPKEEVAAPKRTLQPSRPEDYGMVVFEKPTGTMTEAEIDSYMRDKLQQVKAQFPKETIDKVNQIIKEDPQKTQEKIAQFDKAILECQNILKYDPFDEDAKQRLQKLYMLKSIAREMPEK